MRNVLRRVRSPTAITLKRCAFVDVIRLLHGRSNGNENTLTMTAKKSTYVCGSTPMDRERLSIINCFERESA